MTGQPNIPTVKLADAASILGYDSTRATESALRRAGITSGYPLPAVEWLRDNPGPGQGARTDIRPTAEANEMTTIRAQQRRRSYAQGNPDVAYPPIRETIEQTLEHAGIPRTEPDLRAAAEHIVDLWTSPDRAKGQNITQFVVAQLRSVQDVAGWESYVRSLPERTGPVRPRADRRRWPIKRATCWALMKIHHSPVAWTTRICGLVGAWEVATLSDYGLVERNPVAPLTLRVTERGKQIVELLTGAGIDTRDTRMVWAEVADQVVAVAQG